MEKGFEYFIRISRFSDKNWCSYKMPKQHNWHSEHFETLEQMLEAGAVKTGGLAGIEWPKPFFDMQDVVFRKGFPGFSVQPKEDVTVQDLIADGFIVRLYVGEKIENIQDGVIFKPMPLNDDEADKIMETNPELEIYPENYKRGLLQADGNRWLYNASLIWDY